MIVENIKAIAKLHGIKIGELERKCGVSQGYFSRVRKNEGAIPIRVIDAASRCLGTEIDSLVHYNIAKQLRIREVEAELERLRSDYEEVLVIPQDE